MRCAIYTRVSTENQAEKKYNSCEAQEEKIKAFIKSQEGLTLYKVYSDSGYSGASLDRPALKELINDINKGDIECVLTYKIDRLTRSPKDFYTLIEFFEKHGVSFISITENFDTSSPSGRLLRNIMLTFAQFERELTAERTKDKMEARAKKGLWNGGIVPYGYRSVDKKLVINEKEAECVRKIFEIFLETNSLAETRRRINLIYRTRKGKKFNKGTIDHILRNPIYCGKVKYKDRLYKGVHEAIISEAMFLKVQSIRNIKMKPETKINRVYLLSGLLKCKECSSAMTPTYTKNRSRDGQGSRFTYYYRCTKTYKHDWHSCSIKSINADRIEKFILNRLKEVSHDERVIESLIRRINQREEERLYPLKQQEEGLLKEIGEVEKKIKNLISVLAEGEARKFPSIKKELENLENKKKVLEFDLEGIRLSIQKERQERFEAKIVLDTLRNFVQKIETVSVEDRPRLFQYLIKDILYGKDEIDVNIFYLPSPEVIKTSSILSSKWLPLLNDYRTLPLRFKNELYQPRL